MKQLACICICLGLYFTVSAQEANKHVVDSIVQEGKALYRSEMASWYGTDIFLEVAKDQRNNIGGYFSYADKAVTRCVFFSKDAQPQVIGSITFDSSFNTATAVTDTASRPFTTYETGIYSFRKNALSEIQKDTFFKVYKNTDLNLIPITGETENKVYVLTGPQVSGVVVFGNDYLLTFDKKSNQLLSKKVLHKNILPIEYSKEAAFASVHTHLPETGDYITATDICTLMLYEKMAQWSVHYVMSANFVSIWNCANNQLTTVTRASWDKRQLEGKK